MQFLKYIIGVLLLTAFAQSALAVAPANTRIQTSASLTYDGLAAPITVSVRIQVLLKTSAPNLEITLDNVVAERQASVATLTLTTTANGLDTYTLTPALTLSGVENTSTPIYQLDAVTTSAIDLGATAAGQQAVAGQNLIEVPWDGAAGPSVNGIIADDRVLIGTREYEVDSVTDNGSSKTITLKSNLVDMVPFGTLIAERREITVTIEDVGSLTAEPPGLIENRTVVTNTGTEFIDIFHETQVVQVEFRKLVRNVTNPNGDPADVVAVAIMGENYFSDVTDTVKALRDDVVEYAIIVTAPTGTAINNARVFDTVPVFTSYVPNSTLINNIEISGDSDVFPLLTPGILVDSDETRTAGTEASGVIAAGAEAVITFRVTVD